MPLWVEKARDLTYWILEIWRDLLRSR